MYCDTKGTGEHLRKTREHSAKTREPAPSRRHTCPKLFSKPQELIPQNRTEKTKRMSVSYHPSKHGKKTDILFLTLHKYQHIPRAGVRGQTPPPQQKKGEDKNSEPHSSIRTAPAAQENSLLLIFVSISINNYRDYRENTATKKTRKSEREHTPIILSIKAEV